MKNKRGSIILFVLFSGLFFVMFLSSILMYGSIKRQSEAEVTKKAEEIYGEKDKNEIYNSYFGEGAIPIYTKEQLFKIASGENIQINEEGGKIYNFNSNSIYVLKNDIEFEYHGIWRFPALTGNGRIEGNGKQLKIRDTSRKDEAYYILKNDYKVALTENGEKYPKLINKNIIEIDLNAQNKTIQVPTSSKHITWNVENTNIASVTQTGLVTGNVSGTTKLIAQTNDGSNYKQEVELKVIGVNLLEDNSFEVNNITATHISNQNAGIEILTAPFDGAQNLPASNGKKLLYLYYFPGQSVALTDIYAYINKSITLQGGKTYTFSFDYMGAGSITGASSFWLCTDSQGVQSHPISFSTNAKDKIWRRLSTTWTCPAGGATVQLRFGFHCTSDAWMAIDAVKIEEGYGSKYTN